MATYIHKNVCTLMNSEIHHWFIRLSEAPSCYLNFVDMLKDLLTGGFRLWEGNS